MGLALLTAYYFVPTGNNQLLHAKETSLEWIESIWAAEAQGNLTLPLTRSGACGNCQAPSPQKHRCLHSLPLSLTLPEERIKEYMKTMHTLIQNSSHSWDWTESPQDLCKCHNVQTAFQVFVQNKSASLEPLQASSTDHWQREAATKIASG